MKRVLVTGGAGFIGSNFIRYLIGSHDCEIVNLDKLTYAGNPDNLLDVKDEKRYRFVLGDICDPIAVREAMRGCDVVVNFAAESHVDRSFTQPDAFLQTDVCGVFVLLEQARLQGIDRFLHISTDEVYGPRFPASPAFEADILAPANPYAASKAGGEMQCQAFFRSYGLPVIVTRSRNNIGPYQYPEKAVPLFATNAIEGKLLPVYGDGMQVRDRLYVDDNCEALALVIEMGVPGEIYNVGADNERTNIDVVETILRILGKPRDLIRFVEDRTLHDARYSIDLTKIRSLGWKPRHDYDSAMEKTVGWYRDNQWWWGKIKSGEFAAFYQDQYAHRLANSSPPANTSGGA